MQRQPAVVGYFDQDPYAVALVDIDEQPGVRLPGRVVDIDPDDVTIGMRPPPTSTTSPAATTGSPSGPEPG